MNKKVYVVFIIVVILAGIGWLWSFALNKAPVDDVAGNSFKDTAYIIDGTVVQLVDGVAESNISEDSSSKVITRFFGNEVEADLNNDGLTDIAFLLTQNSGGSGTFFYVVAAIKQKGGTYRGSDSVLLGDRIAPQTTEVKENGIVVVNYAIRNDGESFDVRPSVGKSIWLKLDDKTMQFGIVEPNFEGEADPSRMKLNMKPWVWMSVNYSNGEIRQTREPRVFVMTFNPDGTMSAATDCNNLGGKYAESQGGLSFSGLTSTLMFCENSEEGLFQELLGRVEGYQFTSKGELVMSLKSNQGTMIFR